MLVNKEIKAFSSVQTANIFFEQSVNPILQNLLK